MWHLIVLELKKFGSVKHHWILLLIFCILFGSDIQSKIMTQIPIADHLNTKIFNSLNGSKMSLETLRPTLSESLDPSKVKQMIEWIEEDLEFHYKMQYGIMAQSWDSYLENKIASDTLRLNHLEEAKPYAVWYQTEEELQETLSINNILLQKHIVPMDTEKSMTGYNYLVLFFGSPFVYVMLAICLYFSSSVLPSEFEKGTYKLLLTQPISKIKILISKLVATLLVNYSWILIVLGVSLYYVNSKCGMGDPRYPIKLFINGTETYSTMQTYVGIASLFLFLLVTIVTVLCFGVAVLVKQSTLAFAISTGMVMLLGFLPLQGVLTNWAHVNPFSFLMMNHSLKGNLAQNIGNMKLDVNHGLFTLLGFIIVLTSISLIAFKHQQQKN